MREIRILKKLKIGMLFCFLTLFAFFILRAEKYDAKASSSYLVLDRACKNTKTVTIPYLEKSSSLFIFSLLREGAWSTVYCADLGKSASSYTEMTRDDSILDELSDEKRELLSYVPAFGLGSAKFPAQKITDPRGISNTQKTYSILMQGYVWAVLKGVVACDEQGNLEGLSNLRAIMKKINQYTYDSESGAKLIEQFLARIKEKASGQDEYSLAQNIPVYFAKTKKLASKNPIEMSLKDDGSLEFEYTDSDNILEKGELVLDSSLLSYRREGNTYIFTVAKEQAENFRAACQAGTKPSVCFQRTVTVPQLKTIEGWRMANKNKAYQNFIYLEGESVKKTIKSYLSFDLSKTEPINITVYKRDGSDTSILLSGAEFALQAYSDTEKKYGTIMSFTEKSTGEYSLLVAKDLLTDTTDNAKLKFRILETKVPEGYSGKSAFKKTVTGTELVDGNTSFTAYNSRRKIKLSLRKVDETLLNYKIAQFLSAKADTSFAYQDPSVYELKYRGTDEAGNPVYRSEYDEFLAELLGEIYTDENGIFDQKAYTDELGHSVVLGYKAKISSSFSIYEYSKTLGDYKSEALLVIETKEGIFGPVTTPFIYQTEDNEGKLKIEESVYPDGYEKTTESVFYIEMDDGNDSKTVTISNELTGKFVTNTKASRRIQVKKQVKPIQLTVGEKEVVLSPSSAKGAVFAVYAAENIGRLGVDEYLYKSDDLVCTIEIGEDGSAQSPYLYPGKYRVSEIKAPTGYYLEKQEKEVLLSDADVSVEFENEPISEEIRIQKKDGEEGGTLKGAVLGLYAAEDIKLGDEVLVKKDTLLLQKEVTEDDTVFSNLPFGKYYVKEIQAPYGYQCSEVKLEFDMPRTPFEKKTVVLYGVFQNFVKADRKLTLVKEIELDDAYLEQGNPTFLFQVTGTDYKGERHSYQKVISFSKEDLAQKINRKEVVFEALSPGVYEAYELEVSRYRLKEIKEIENGLQKEERVEFDLEKNSSGKATFVNEKYEWQGYGHNDLEVNHFTGKETEEEKDLKGLAVTCSDFMDTETLDLSKFRVYVQYRDGSAKQVDITKCKVLPEKINAIDQVFTNVQISYEEEGKELTVEVPVLYYEGDKNIELYETELLSDGTVAIVAYNGNETELRIPALIDGRIVSRMGKAYVKGKKPYVVEGSVSEKEAAENKKYYQVAGLEAVTKLSFPNTVNTIGYAAFYQYKNLEEVDLNQVSIIRGQAFRETGLSGRLIIPGSVTSIGDSVFRECNITELRLGTSLQFLGGSAFRDCKQLTGSVRIPTLLSKIDSMSFANCDLTELIFEGGVNEIGSLAFAENKNLTQIEFVDCAITKIAQKAFYLQEEALLDTVIKGGNAVVTGFDWKLGGRNPVFS